MVQSLRLIAILLIFIGYSESVYSNAVSGVAKEIDAADYVYSGVIGDQDKFRFTLLASDAIHFTVTQPNSDVKLRLFSRDLGAEPQLLFEASIPASHWLDEHIVVGADRCSQCEIHVLPVSPADSAGHYQLSVEHIETLALTDVSQILELWTDAAIQWFGASIEQSLLSNVLSAYQQAANIAEVSALPNLAVTSHYLASQVEHLLGHYQNQESILDQLSALKVNTAIELKSRILIDLANIALGEDRLDKAEGYLQQAQAIAVSENDLLMQAKVNGGKGAIYHAQGHLQKAKGAYEKANEIYLSTGNWQLSIDTLISLGWFEYRRGNWRDALTFYRKALSFALKSQSLKSQVDINTKIGTIHRRLGNIRQANDYVDNALRHSDSLSHSLLNGWAKQEKARIYMSTGLFALAKDMFEEARKAFERLNAESDISNIDFALIEVHQRLGDLSLSLEYLKQVLAHDLSRGNLYNIGSDYSRMAELAYQLDNVDAAFEYQAKAFEYLEGVDDSYLLGRLYSQAAMIYADKGAIGKAKAYFAEARAFQNTSQDSLGLIETDYREAEALKEVGDKSQALVSLTNAIERIQTFKSTIKANELKKNFLSVQQRVAELHLELMRKIGESPIAMLDAAEEFRAQSLYDKVSSLKRNQSVSQDLLNKRQALEGELLREVIDYHQLSDSDNRDDIVKQTHSLVLQIDSLDAHIQTASEKRLHKDDVRIPVLGSIDNIQQRLPARSIMLYFDTGQSESHLWVLSSNSIDYVTLPPEKVLSNLLSPVLDVIRQAPVNEKRTRVQRKVLKALSDTLFSQVNVDWQRYDDIVVVPDGALNYLPFSILSLPGYDQNLVNSKTISYAPSIHVWDYLQNQSLATEGRVLVVANPKMSSPNSDLIAQNRRMGFNSAELPYSKKEAEAIRQVTQTNAVFLNREEASKAEIMSLPLSEFRIMHFATHGVTNSYVPSLGGLVLSNVASNDNLLLSPEIMNLDLNAELVVLSACETGAGTLLNGEGLQGLSRAFFEAGTKRVIASLWPVQDDATSVLMASFYEQLLQHKKPAEEALRLAKMSVKNYQRKNLQQPWKDPFYWAGFVLQGPGGKVGD